MIRYLEDSIENMRDIGGYKSNIGKSVKIGKLIRSNLPINLSDKDTAMLQRMGIHTIIDLRSLEEIKSKPSVFENNKEFKIYHIGIDIGKDIPKTEEMVPKSYMNILNLQEKIRTVFEIFADNENILYFCTAGKDRTGVITALMLKLLGVSDKDIVEDYVATKEFMSEILKRFANNDDEILNIITPKKIYMEDFLKLFEDKYKSIENYLMLVGISTSTIEDIRNRFLEKH